MACVQPFAVVIAKFTAQRPAFAAFATATLAALTASTACFTGLSWTWPDCHWCRWRQF